MIIMCKQPGFPEVGSGVFRVVAVFASTWNNQWMKLQDVVNAQNGARHKTRLTFSNAVGLQCEIKWWTIMKMVIVNRSRALWTPLLLHQKRLLQTGCVILQVWNCYLCWRPHHYWTQQHPSRRSNDNNHILSRRFRHQVISTNKISKRHTRTNHWYTTNICCRQPTSSSR